MPPLLVLYDYVETPGSRPVPTLPSSLDVTDLEEVDNLLAHMVQVGSLDADTCPVEDGTPLLEAYAAANSDRAIFGCVRLTSIDDYPVAWRIDLGIEQAASVVIYQQLSDGPFEVLANDGSMTLADRQNDYPRLSSWPIVFGPLETIELRIRLLPSFNSYNPRFAVALLPEVDFDRAIRGRTHLMGGLVASCGLLLLFFLTFASLLQSRPAWRYALYFVFVALLIWTREYYPLVLFPQTLPAGMITILEDLLNSLLLITHVRFVQAFVAESLPDHPLALVGGRVFRFAVAAFLFRLVALGVMSAAAAYWQLWEGSDGFAAVQAMLTLCAQVFGLLLLPALVASYAGAVSVMLVARRIDGGWLFALGASVLFPAVLWTLYMTLQSQLPNQVQGDTAWFSVLYVFDGMIFAAAIARQTFGLRRQRDAALEAELLASREQARLAQTLLSARGDLDRARDLAERHRSRLALTSHDLRQPLLSLRLSLTEAERDAPGLADALRPSLEYLGAVLEESLEDSRPDADHDGGATDDHHAQEAADDVLPLDVILRNAVRMFSDEAAAKGLRLRHVPCSLDVHASPVPLIRMVSNLLSNAIKYTDAGSVLIGVRRRGDRVALEVHDTGPGLTEAEIAEVRQAYRRGSQSDTVDGEGIGLVSAEMLAARQGLALAIRSVKGHGSCFAIEGLRPAQAESEARSPVTAEPALAANEGSPSWGRRTPGGITFLTGQEMVPGPAKKGKRQ